MAPGAESLLEHQPGAIISCRMELRWTLLIRVG